MIQGGNLENDLRLACVGDRAAAERVYDQTCADAWTLARCVVSEPETAKRVMIEAYRDVLNTASDPESSLSPRALVLSIVHDRARAERVRRL